VGERDTVYLFLVRDHAELSRVAEAEGSPPLGYLVAARSADGESAFIFHVHVSEGRRSAGVGTALVRDFEEGARALGVRLAWFLAARGSVAFYERLGYAPDPGALPPDLARYVREAKHSIVMSKRLGRTGQAGRGDDQEPSGDKCFSSGPQVST
jgi:GNAT superfamily N-acetyltransferase